MKKIAVFITMIAALALSAFTAHADVKLNIYIDNPEYVKVSVDYSETSVNKGMNTLTLDDYASVSIENRDWSKHWINHVWCDGESLVNPGGSLYLNQYNIRDYNGKTLVVESCTRDELRTASFMLKVDNPSRISNFGINGQISSYVSMKTFPAGEFCEVRYSPEYNTSLSISANGPAPYKVLVDGEEIPQSPYSVSINNLHQDMTVEIIANYPDEEATVTFDLKNDAKDYVKEFYIYGSAAENYSKTPVDISSGSAKIPLGKQVVIGHVTNYRDFTLAEYKAGSYTTTSTSETAQFYVTSDVTVSIDASYSPAFNVTIDIDNPDAILSKRNSYSKDVLELSEGENTVAVHETNKDLSFKAKPGYKVESVTKNGEPVSAGWDGSYSIYGYNVSEGDKYVVTSSKLPVFDTWITIDEPANVIVKRYVNSSDFQPVTLEMKKGRNKIECAEGEINSSIYVYPAEGCWINSVNLNGDNQTADYSGYFKLAMQADYEAAVSSEVIDRAQSYVIWFDNIKAPNLESTQWRYNNGKVQDPDIHNGYQVKTFFHGDNYFELNNNYTYGAEQTAAIYLNDEKLPFSSTYAPNVKIEEMKDGDVIRVFLETAAPQFYKVNLSVTDSENPKVAGKVVYDAVMRDVIRKVDDLSKELSVLRGTRFDITLSNDSPEDVDILLTANGVAVQPDENGVYSIEVNADTDINLSYEMVPYAELFLVGDFNGWTQANPMLTDDGKTYTCTVDALEGQFKITTPDWSTIVLGSNGSGVEFGTPYEVEKDGRSNMTLAAGGATDVKVSLDLPTLTMTLDGTAGITTIGCDGDAGQDVWFSLQGMRIEGRPSAPGVYILRSADGRSEKVCIR